MLQAFISTIFFIITTLALCLVLLSLIFGKWGLWLGAALAAFLIIRWLYFEFENPHVDAARKIPASLLLNALGWKQPTVDIYQKAKTHLDIRLEFSYFRKPKIVLTQKLWDSTSPSDLKLLLNYFSELARELDSHKSTKLVLILLQIFNQYGVHWFKQAKEVALIHLYRWHGLPAEWVEIRLTQFKYRTHLNEMMGLNKTFFQSFPFFNR